MWHLTGGVCLRLLGPLNSGLPRTFHVRNFIRSGRNFPVQKQTKPASKWGSLVKPVVFTTGVSLLSFEAAGIWIEERVRRDKEKSHFNRLADFLPRKHQKAGDWRQDLNDLWNSLNDGQKVFVPIFALNAVVFCLWQIPAMSATMARLFTSSPTASKNCLPMVLSAFSHNNFFHFGINMFVLNSFISPLVYAMGMEHFTAFFVSSAVISSLASYAYRIAVGSIGSSLGASGAICAMVGCYGALMPSSLVHIVFLPMYTFTIGSAVKTMMAFDTIGMLARWKIFDHAAHLGGMIFGVLYCQWVTRKT